MAGFAWPSRCCTSVIWENRLYRISICLQGRSSPAQIAAKRLPITTEQERSPPTSIRTKSPFLADVAAS